MKRLFISIHDVAPCFLKELEVIFNELDKVDINKYDILVVPNWHNKFPINENEEFIGLVESHLHEDSKIVLHGYSHSSDKKIHWLLYSIFGYGRGIEFQFTSNSAIETKIGNGLKLIEETFDTKPIGFVPPNWVYSRKKENMLRKDFRYYTNHFEVNYFTHNIPAISLAYTGGKNHALKRINQLKSSLGVRDKKSGDVRLSIHPQDVQNGNFKYGLRDLRHLLKKNWKPYLYEDFIDLT